MRLLTRQVCRVRMVSGLAAAFSLVTLLLTVAREIGLRSAGGTVLCVGNGCVQVGVNQVRFQSGWSPIKFERGPFYMGESWHADWLTAWRPFHVHVSSGSSRQRMIVAPLWPVVLISVAGFAWSSGLLAGMRRARSHGCTRCGYDLRLTPITDGARKCPECGSRQGVDLEGSATLAG